MPLLLIAFWLLCLDVILAVEGSTSIVVDLIAGAAALLALLAYSTTGGSWLRRP